MSGSDDDRLGLDCSVIYVQSKRTDGPLVNNLVFYLLITRHADPYDHIVNLQQPEGGPCGHEQRSQEADAGEVPQHEQVRGYQ